MDMMTNVTKGKIMMEEGVMEEGGIMITMIKNSRGIIEIKEEVWITGGRTEEIMAETTGELGDTMEMEVVEVVEETTREIIIEGNRGEDIIMTDIELGDLLLYE